MDKLIDCLSKKQDDVEVIINVVETNLKDIKDYIFNNLDSFVYQNTEYNYERRYIFNNKNYEILCLIWNSNSESPIHNHAKNGCIMKILEGQLEEHLYDINNIKLINIKKIDSNTKSQYIDDKIGIHKIINTNINKTYSLHIYSPPKHKVIIYK
jgi:cysteine dioxygenase